MPAPAFKNRLAVLEDRAAPLAAAQWYEDTLNAESDRALELGCIAGVLTLLIHDGALIMPSSSLWERLKAAAHPALSPEEEAVRDALAHQSAEEVAEAQCGVALMCWEIFEQSPACCHAPNARVQVLILAREYLGAACEELATCPLPAIARLMAVLCKEARQSREFSLSEALCRARRFTWST